MSPAEGQILVNIEDMSMLKDIKKAISMVKGVGKITIPRRKCYSAYELSLRDLDEGIYKPTAEGKYGLTRIGIFGSVARGEQTDLERMLGSRVDLVRVRDGMNSLLRERIRKEAVYV